MLHSLNGGREGPSRWEREDTGGEKRETGKKRGRRTRRGVVRGGGVTGSEILKFRKEVEIVVALAEDLFLV